MNNDGSWIGAGSGDISNERFLPDGDGINNKQPVHDPTQPIIT